MHCSMESLYSFAIDSRRPIIVFLYSKLGPYRVDFEEGFDDCSLKLDDCTVTGFGLKNAPGISTTTMSRFSWASITDVMKILLM